MAEQGIRCERKPITTMTWTMRPSPAIAYIIMNTLEKKKVHRPDRRIEIDRRYFLYDRHIPERRSGKNRRWLTEEERAMNDQRHRNR